MKINQIERLTLNVGISIYGKQSIKWIKELRDNQTSLTDPVNLSPLDKSARKLFEKSFFLSYLSGWDEVNQEVQRQIGEDTKNLYDPLTGSGFDEALLLLKQKRSIPAHLFKQAQAGIKGIAFSVQTLERLHSIEMVRQSLIYAVDKGLDLKFWRNNLDLTFEAMGVTPLSPHHLETVFRTNIHSVYNIAHRQSALQNKFVTDMEFNAVNDDRVTVDICLPLDGLIYEKNDPIWANITPPNHYSCRSRVRALVQRYMKRKGLTRSRSMDPKKLEWNPKKQSGIHPDFKKSPLNLQKYNNLLKDRIAEKLKNQKKSVK